MTACAPAVEQAEEVSGSLDSYLRQRGNNAEFEMVSEGRTKAGLTHTRMQQTVAGLRVHGAYVKATMGGNGQVKHLIDRTVAVKGAPQRASIDERAALNAALAELGYTESAGSVVSSGARMTRFERQPAFYREPTVERVAVVDGAGAAREAFVVETWSLKGNQLDYTLVDGSGAIVSIERRTNNDRYNVFAVDPSKTPQAVVTGPAPSTESPSGWLGTGSQTTINIKGNNVSSYLDTDANNAADPGGTAVTNGDFLTAADLTVSPTTTGNREVAVQNLFYLNNFVHDVLYTHGFNEAAGNFQVNNFGRGGNANDPVNAEAQDGSGTDNANFSTPNDGSSPRMQMYLWTGQAPTAVVYVSPTQSYNGYASSFGPALTLAGTAIAPVVLVNDGVGVGSDGCEAMTGLSGAIALIDRGSCNFTVKVSNAQKAGAIAVLIANNVDSAAFSPGGTDRKIRIPSAMISQADGQTLRAAATSASLRKSTLVALQIDGDVDSDIVYHEYGHGLTWRMIGSMSGAVPGAIGEGASDTVAFLINGDPVIGEYSFSSAAGIRRYSYDAYALTYKDFSGAEVHNDGEIYAAAMWQVAKQYQAAGYTMNDVLADFVGGMNYTPSAPSFEDMRDGMATQAATQGRECLVWRGFATLGIGTGSSLTVSRRGAVTVVESFSIPASCP